jgi:hypothetical protein
VSLGLWTNNCWFKVADCLGLLGVGWVAVRCYLTGVDLGLLSNKSIGPITPYQVL